MHLEFPDDPACDTLDRQYMLGEALLVAPVFSFDGFVDYYLPAGQWTNLLTGQPIEGGRWIREKHDTLSIPLLARHGYQIPISISDDKIEDSFVDEIGVLNFSGVLPTTFDMKGQPSKQTLKQIPIDEFVAWVNLKSSK